MKLRLGAVLLFGLLSGCGDSFQFSAGRSTAQAPSDGFFEERGEADEAPNPPEQEGGGEVFPE
jgi:hypothetical protein